MNTGNANLDTLLQAVISGHRTQSASVTTSEANQSNQDNAATALEPAVPEVSASVADNGQVASPAIPDNSNQVVPYTDTTTIPALARGYLSVNLSQLQRSLSRVPYNAAAISDTANAAWVFNPGVLEKIVATSQARGYFSGNEYYIEPVNIINGNGYYNLFKQDGTYLFTLNAKTGYFVGNAPGHADALDY